ncbi:glycosyltransferase family 2 protein [Candidatus Spongiisocius sp.]|uniref:glycosyltransferase family 2 protein n=1 Tax=Candidatus Spongiisocius sp. TaxID=3101273 RepID=UPI003B59B3BE
MGAPSISPGCAASIRTGTLRQSPAVPTQKEVRLSELPHVSVVMAVRNEAAHIETTLQAVLDQDYEGRLEVVVADGRSTDGTLAILRRCASEDSRLKLVDNPELGVAAGLNRAIDAAAGRVLVRCDGHAEFAPDYVRLAVGLLEETGAANVGGKQDAAGTSTLQRAIAIAMNSPAAAGTARFRHSSQAGPADTVYLGVFDRRALEEVGGFDPTLVRNQDFELNHRLRKSGNLVWFDPRLAVTYHPRSSLRALWRQYLDYGRWKRVMLLRNPGALAARQLAAPALVIGLIGAAIGAGIGVPFWWIPPAGYGMLIAVTTLWETIRRRDRAAWLLPAVMPAMHLAWGIGFLFVPTGGRLAIPVEGSS